MIKRTSSARLALAVGLFFPIRSEAMAPLYFDLRGLIVSSGFYLLGLVGIAIAIGVSRDRAVKAFLSWSLVLYVVSPIAYYYVTVSQIRSSNTRLEDELKLGKEKNIEAFANFCKVQKPPSVYSRAPQGDGAAIFVVPIYRNVGDRRSRLDAYTLSDFLTRRKSCASYGVRQLEGIYDGQYSKEKRGYEREYRRYAVCTQDKKTVHADTASRYELVSGNTVSEPVPWGSNSGNSMAKSSIRIIDKSNGSVLAEDTLYFLDQDNSGEAGCPIPIYSVARLIQEVFGNPTPAASATTSTAIAVTYDR
jgi:hypothetical protein